MILHENSPRPTLGIIGGGIAGLGVAYKLQDAFDITIFERDTRFGGHIRPAAVEDEQGQVWDIDTGFLGYEPLSYANIDQLMQELGVATCEREFDVTVWDRASGRQHRLSEFPLYCGSRFDRRAAVDERRLLAFLLQIENNPTLLDDHLVRLDEFFVEKGYHADVLQFLVIPSLAATWGFQDAQVRAVAAPAAMQLLRRYSHPGRGPSPTTRAYLDLLLSHLGNVRLYGGTEVHAVEEKVDGVQIRCRADVYRFDYAVLTTHADQALQLLAHPTDAQRQILSRLTYNKSLSVLHTDARLVPPAARRHTPFILTWIGPQEQPYWVITWDMGTWHHLPCRKTFFISVGDDQLLGGSFIDPRLVRHVFHNTHPALTPDFLASQRNLSRLNQGHRLYFSGSYFGPVGTQECAYTSALEVSTRLRAVVYPTFHH
jgi:predicted NAD/FAD-binding protein